MTGSYIQGFDTMAKQLSFHFDLFQFNGFFFVTRTNGLILRLKYNPSIFVGVR